MECMKKLKRLDVLKRSEDTSTQNLKMNMPYTGSSSAANSSPHMQQTNTVKKDKHKPSPPQTPLIRSGSDPKTCSPQTASPCLNHIRFKHGGCNDVTKRSRRIQQLVNTTKHGSDHKPKDLILPPISHKVQLTHHQTQFMPHPPQTRLTTGCNDAPKRLLNIKSSTKHKSVSRPNELHLPPISGKVQLMNHHTEHHKRALQQISGVYPDIFQVTVGVQTDYRESETQTDPYSPEYVAQPGTTPTELLQLAALSWGRGLPAGLSEVELVQRARAKRAWEATLPPLDDLSQLDKRRRMMEEMEAEEWAFRDEQIQKLQKASMAALKDLLRQRDEVQREIKSERLNQILSHYQKDRETKLDKIHSDYIRSLRKLEAKRRNVEGKVEGHDIVRDCIDSQRYDCRETKRKAHNNELKSHYVDEYEGLIKLEAGLSASVFKPKVKRTKPKISNISDVIKPPMSRAEELIDKYEALREEKKKQDTEKSLRFLVKKEKPVPCPVTPRVEEPPEGNEEIELRVIDLQKSLRGRSNQLEMFKGKENHLGLIQELRTVHALHKEEQELQNADKALAVTLKKQRDKQGHKTYQMEASQARVKGLELEHLFDTLSKELIHLQEERRIHAFRLLAERDRRLREAEESGKRQVEELRQREEDKIFRKVVLVHQETVDVFLEDVILETLEQTAHQEAREEIRRRSKEVNDIAYAMEESRNNLQSEEIVSELVYSFLVPEVEKISVRQRMHQGQQRHLQAAQSIIQGTLENSGSHIRATSTSDQDLQLAPISDKVKLTHLQSQFKPHPPQNPPTTSRTNVAKRSARLH